jgi:hypothetical protein
MATRKLSLPLFSAKTLVSQPGCSTRYFHFIANHDFSGHGLPARCSACGAQIHFKENANANHQG